MKGIVAGILGLALSIPLAVCAASSGAKSTATATTTAPEPRTERMERRMQLTRTLGIAEALDLDMAQALLMGEAMAKLDVQRQPFSKQIQDNMDLLQRAASGDASATARVDQAIQRINDARAHLHALNQESFKTLTQGLSPEKRARLYLFLAQFHRRFGGIQGGDKRGGHGHGGHGPGLGAARGADDLGDVSP